MKYKVSVHTHLEESDEDVWGYVSHSESGTGLGMRMGSDPACHFIGDREEAEMVCEQWKSGGWEASIEEV